MSGEGLGFLLALPIIVGGAAIAGAGLAAYGVAKVGVSAGKAAYSYYKKREEERQEIIKSGIRSDLGLLHADIESTLSSMNSMGNGLYQSLEQEMFARNDEMLDILRQSDMEQYQQYLGQMRNTQKDACTRMEEMRKKFDREYAQKMEAGIFSIQKNTEQHADRIVKEIENFEGSKKEREQFAADMAKKYLDETEKILDALLKGFDTDRLMPEMGETFRRHLNDGIDMYNSGNYQGAIAAAQSVQLDIGVKTYELEKADIDWDVAYQAALSAAEMVKVYLESQACFDEKAAKEIRKITGIEIPEELYGEEIADYSGKDADGRNLYQENLARIQRVSDLLTSDQARGMSVSELRDLTDNLLTVSYPDALQTVQDSVMNMSNAAYRVEKANEFGEFLESKDFEVRTFFEEDDFTSPVSLAVYNSATGEKVVYTLSKQRPGELPNQVNIVYRLAQGDETDEARNRYYQNLISEFTGAQKMACNQATVGQLSATLTEKAREELRAFDV